MHAENKGLHSELGPSALTRNLLKLKLVNTNSDGFFIVNIKAPGMLSLVCIVQTPKLKVQIHQTLHFTHLVDPVCWVLLSHLDSQILLCLTGLIIQGYTPSASRITDCQ